MAKVGLHNIYLGVKNADGTVDVTDVTGLSTNGAYEAFIDPERENLGAKTANITNLAGNAVKLNGNDETSYTSYGPASPSVALDFVSLDPVILNKILGKVKSADGGWIQGEKQVSVGLIIVSKNINSRKYSYTAFGRGTFAQASQNIQTNTDTAEVFADDTLTYTAQSYKGFNNKPYAIYNEMDEEFSLKKMLDTVFPGQTLAKDEKVTEDDIKDNSSK